MVLTRCQSGTGLFHAEPRMSDWQLPILHPGGVTSFRQKAYDSRKSTAQPGTRFAVSCGMPVFRLGHNWDPFRDLEREVDRLLRDVNMTFQGVRFDRRYPLINLFECQDRFLLTAEVPGTELEDLEVTVADGVLTLKGERKSSAVSPDAFRRQERFQGAWQRSLPLPDRIESEKLSASLNDGVLTITLPKATQTQLRQIPVVSD